MKFQDKPQGYIDEMSAAMSAWMSANRPKYRRPDKPRFDAMVAEEVGYLSSLASEYGMSVQVVGLIQWDHLKRSGKKRSAAVVASAMASMVTQ